MDVQSLKRDDDDNDITSYNNKTQHNNMETVYQAKKCNREVSNTNYHEHCTVGATWPSVR